MIIKASAAAEISALVKSLSAHDEVTREAAVARLAVIGARAAPHLVTAYRTTSDRACRVAILRALEPIGDHRAGAVAREAIREGGDLAVAAASVLSGLLDSTHGTAGADALDTLMTAALDATAERRVRLAAIDAVENISEGIRQKLTTALGSDRDAVIRGRATPSASAHAEANAIWKDALDGNLPDDPGLLRHVVATKGETAPLSEMRKLVDRVREREHDGTSEAAPDWRLVRGAIHQALALRGSRVALYDLRESLEAASTQLPSSFVTAVQVVGDASCLDAIAAAYSRSASGEDRWRHLLASAFKAIAVREKVTKRHSVMKRISAKWPDAGRKLAELPGR